MNAEQPVSPDLIEAAIKGGTAQADDLIRVVWPHAFRIAYSVVRNRAMAEDAAQEACAVLFRSIGRLRRAEAFTVWFYRIVVRQALALERRNAAASVASAPKPKEGLDESLMRVDVYNALATLTPQQRVAIALHYYAQMSSPEIGEILGIQGSSVRFHIMRAKQSLQKRLKDRNDEHARVEEPYGAA